MLEVDVVDATARLNLARSMKGYNRPFDVIGTYRLIDDGERPEATVMLRAGDQEMHEAGIGVGPVDALANVLKKSLGRLFPDLLNVRLVDFEVRLIQGTIGTSAQVAVSIVFSDGSNLWRVSSADDNINLASFRALLDGYEYAVYLWDSGKGGGKREKRKTKVHPSTGSGRGSPKAKGKRKGKT
ncbi:MAG: alpha-isopropylmalate synthase regulatory domain-containing protein [bacterium]|nr:alpha-isopropylmalate synthase regulatory domain-containing protein [bacterium]MDT8396911.1 alpha-isopropylmalate synthase regulatory domain-containing protein [bacterium]